VTSRTTTARQFRKLVGGHVHIQSPFCEGLQAKCALERDEAGPLADRTLGDIQSSGERDLRTAEVCECSSFQHGCALYSMLNSQGKHAKPLYPYASGRMETMGDRIRQLRNARALTQEGLGRLVGVTKSAVSQWEDGSTKNLKLETFLRVCEALKTDAEYLIWGADRAAAGPGGVLRRVWKPKPGPKSSGT
jgi:DNA-binding XRE family transcriptional regulator